MVRLVTRALGHVGRVAQQNDAQRTRLQTGAASVVLVGHSEGGVLALLAARQTSAKAVVLLATPGRPLGQILRDQLARPVLPPDLRTEALDPESYGRGAHRRASSRFLRERPASPVRGIAASSRQQWP